jgi:hypothetical protein
MTPKVCNDFKSLIPPMHADEYKKLEASIKDEGCRDKLIVWDEKGILLDGHNRLEICGRLNKDYEISPLPFPSETEAKLWIIRNQLSRRNLSLEQKTILLGRLYESEKKARGGTGANRHTRQICQNDRSANTAASVAAEYSVSERTVSRAAETVRCIDALKTVVAEVEAKVSSGNISAPLVRHAAKALRDHGPEEAKRILDDGGVQGNEVGETVATACGLSLASRAVKILNKISLDDQERPEALRMVSEWLNNAAQETAEKEHKLKRNCES